jgi:hypothetical protein
MVAGAINSNPCQMRICSSSQRHKLGLSERLAMLRSVWVICNNFGAVILHKILTPNVFDCYPHN